MIFFSSLCTTHLHKVRIDVVYIASFQYNPRMIIGINVPISIQSTILWTLRFQCSKLLLFSLAIASLTYFLHNDKILWMS